MSLKKETIALQNQLARYCRDGVLTEIKGARTERLPHYRRLVYNVMHGILEKAFPIAKYRLKEEEFKMLVDNYLENHDAREPQVWKVPGEFYEFCAGNPPVLERRYPYLLDLLRLEWLEILVYNREDRSIPAHLHRQPALSDRIILNPDHEISQYTFPVFKGNWDQMAEQKGIYHLLIFRHLLTKKVHFLEISPLHVALLEALKTKSLVRSIAQVVEDFDLGDPKGIQEPILTFVYKLFDQGFLLGISEP